MLRDFRCQNARISTLKNELYLVDHRTAAKLFVERRVVSSIQFVHHHLPDGVRSSWTVLKLRKRSVIAHDEAADSLCALQCRNAYLTVTVTLVGHSVNCRLLKVVS